VTSGRSRCRANGRLRPPRKAGDPGETRVAPDAQGVLDPIPCLHCDREFVPAHRFNRLCRACQTSPIHCWNDTP